MCALFKIIVILVCDPKHMFTLISTSLEKLYLSIIANISSSPESDFARCTPLNINIIKPKWASGNFASDL